MLAVKAAGAREGGQRARLDDEQACARRDRAQLGVGKQRLAHALPGSAGAAPIHQRFQTPPACGSGAK